MSENKFKVKGVKGKNLYEQLGVSYDRAVEIVRSLNIQNARYIDTIEIASEKLKGNEFAFFCVVIGEMVQSGREKVKKITEFFKELSGEDDISGINVKIVDLASSNLQKEKEKDLNDVDELIRKSFEINGKPGEKKNERNDDI